MRKILLLLLFGDLLSVGVRTQVTNPEPMGITTTSKMPAPSRASASLPSIFSEAPDHSVVTPNPGTARVPEESDGVGHQTSPPSAVSTSANEAEASSAANDDRRVSEPLVPGEVSTKESLSLEMNSESPRHSLELRIQTDGAMVTGSLKTSDVTRGPSAAMATGSLNTSDVTRGPSTAMATGSLETPDVTRGPSAAMTTGSLEISDVTRGPSGAMATGSLETSDVTRGPSATMATGSLKTSDVTRGPSDAMATGSLETPGVTRGPSDAMATDSLETPGVIRGPSVTMATGSLETPGVTRGPSTTMATGSLAIPEGLSGSPIIWAETSSISTPGAFTNTRSRDPPLGRGVNITLLVGVLVALVVFTILVTLILLWCRRHKRKTGALILNSGGKRNGVMDAWAGPAQVSDEEAPTAAAGGAGGGKGPGVSEGEGSGRRPTLTTFFDRRKSRQGSLELEELRGRPAPVLKGEAEPLVGNKDEAVEAPASQGPEAGDVEAPE